MWALNVRQRVGLSVYPGRFLRAGLAPPPRASRARASPTFE